MSRSSKSISLVAMRNIGDNRRDGSPIYIREQDIEIEVTGRESDGIAVNGELIFCQVYDTRSERLVWVRSVKCDLGLLK